MRKKFLNILCCPETGSELRLEVAEVYGNNADHIKTGRLISVNSNIAYPIVNGVPRFVGKEFYTKSFGFEWKKWARIQFESENVGKPMEGHTSGMFRKITEFSSADIKDKLVVEFGCGPGRFMDIVRNMGGIVVGIDLSLAVDVAGENFFSDENVLIVQGDILKPPFKKQTFDVAYSIGVFHHTPEPIKGFHTMADCVKKNGKISTCVYPKGIFYDYPVLRRFRGGFKFLSKYFGTAFSNTFALLYAQASAYFITSVFMKLNQIKFLQKPLFWLAKHLVVILDLPDKKWRTLDIFDAITPCYASTHTNDEVYCWFVQSSCSEIKTTSWCNTSLTGRKL
jgi:SAM-dependent methyltransferase